MNNLPIDSYLDEISKNIEKNSFLILSAAPGAGKTTRVPVAAAKVTQKKVIVLEPRRMAAVSACYRIAEEQGWQVGNEIGYQVRFENKTNLNTKIIFMTEALLSRKMLNDPELADVGIVVIDEFHERSASTDLTLALLKELISLGSQLKVIIMSATLMATKISSYLNNANTIEIPGKTFPLKIQRQKNPQKIRIDSDFFNNIAAKIKNTVDNTTHDILVFLPGTGEIRKLESLLSSSPWIKNCILLSLHGQLPLEEQRKVLQKADSQKIILSTNVAESSVTVDGVAVVIDSGLEKTSVWDYRTGFSRLELQRISLSSAKQRAGRAARQMPGLCEQLWSEHDELSMTAERVPEIQHIDPSEILMFLSHHGVRNFDNFDWFQKPDSMRLTTSLQKLKLLNIFNSDCSLTDLGKMVLRWPLAPELGVLLAHFSSLQLPVVGCTLVSLIQEADFTNINPDHYPNDLYLASDLDFRMKILNNEIKLDRTELRISALQKVKDSIHSLRQFFNKNDLSNTSLSDSISLKAEILKCWPHRLCRRRENSNKGICFDGHGVQLSNSSFAKNSDFFLILNAVDGVLNGESLVHLAIGYSKDEVIGTLDHLVVTNESLSFVEGKDELMFQTQRLLGSISLEEPRYRKPTNDEIKEHLSLFAYERWESWIKDNESLSLLQLRLNFLIHNKHYVSENIQRTLENFSEREWKMMSLAEAAYNETSYKNLVQKDMIYFFVSHLPTDIQNILSAELPEQLTVPSGKSYKINYDNSESPYLEVRLQEVFGWNKNPTVLDGKIKIKLHLLGPNFRPVQITNDLSSFWKNTYSEVKKELRSRYPKHSWPDNPLEAPAVAGAIRRNRN